MSGARWEEPEAGGFGLVETVRTVGGDELVVINMQSVAGLARGGHMHTCPSCYEHVPCSETCSVEPDLTLDDGTLRGSYVECDVCEWRERVR